ncbi:MAG: YceH family protein [Gammaproteobacteria bacterium]
MNLELSLIETRIIGCLIEKEKTTPDQYPLSLNALTNACNQKSNRDPVMNLSEGEVQQTVDELVKKHLVSSAGGASSRVTKYRHRFANTEFSQYQFNDREMGIVCVLFLRGPQTPGELRGRTNRLCEFNDIQQVEDTLEQLSTREDGPFVVKLPREPGRRESRYAHLFSGEVDISQLPTASEPVTRAEDTNRLDTLEQRVNQLEVELAQLKELLS